MVLHSVGCGKSVMKNYIEIPELKEVPEALYTEDDVIKIANSYFRHLRERFGCILLDEKKLTNEEVLETLKNLGFAWNNTKDDKSVNDMFRV